MKAYVVMEIGWEYDDEYWYRPESEGGAPKVVYLSKDAARRACGKLNAQEVARLTNADMENRDGETIMEFFEVVEAEYINE